MAFDQYRPPVLPWGSAARLALEVASNGDARVVYIAPGSRKGVPVLEGPAHILRDPVGLAEWNELERCLTGTWAMQALGCSVSRDALTTAAMWTANAFRGLLKRCPGWRMAQGVTMRTVAKMIEMKEA